MYPLGFSMCVKPHTLSCYQYETFSRTVLHLYFTSYEIGGKNPISGKPEVGRIRPREIPDLGVLSDLGTGPDIGIGPRSRVFHIILTDELGACQKRTSRLGGPMASPTNGFKKKKFELYAADFISILIDR